MLVLLMGIYKVRRCDSLRWQDIRINFHEDRFRSLEIIRGDTHTGTHTHKEQGDLTSLLLFFRIRAGS
jgi:hypothetical protein